MMLQLSGLNCSASVSTIEYQTYTCIYVCAYMCVCMFCNVVYVVYMSYIMLYIYATYQTSPKLLKRRRRTWPPKCCRRTSRSGAPGVGRAGSPLPQQLGVHSAEGIRVEFSKHICAHHVYMQAVCRRARARAGACVCVCVCS